MNDWNNVWGGAVAVGAVISILFSLWSTRRGHEAIRRWAGEQGLTIVQSSRRLFVPHWRLTLGKRHQFFRVSVRDKQGLGRRGWIRCSAFGHTDPATVEVIWDER